jgi:hypothetical protein
MAVRDSQDISLTITGPIVAPTVRDSQDITLTLTGPIAAPTVRVSQDILLILSPTPSSADVPVFFVIT